jgi:hypothetical protein
MEDRSRSLAELILNKALDRHFDALLKRGIPREVAEREIFDLERAVRCQLRARLSLNGGAA